MSQQPWTTSEVRMLAHLTKRRISRKLIAEKLGRSLASVRAQANRLGIVSRPQRAWDAKQDEALRAALRDGHTINRIAFETDRSVPSVKDRMRAIGIKFLQPETFGGSAMPAQRHLMPQYREVVALAQTGLSTAEIARRTGRRRGTVRKWRMAA